MADEANGIGLKKRATGGLVPRDNVELGASPQLRVAQGPAGCHHAGRGVAVTRNPPSSATDVGEALIEPITPAW